MAKRVAGFRKLVTPWLIRLASPHPIEGRQPFREAKRSPRLVSWNGGGFDLPVIRYRAMLHGVAAPEFYRLDGEWK